MNVKFTKKQKQYILNRIESAKQIAKDCSFKYDGNMRGYKIYLLGALASVLSDLCDENALDLFNCEV